MNGKNTAHYVRNLERIRGFRLLDDFFMTKCFADQTDAAALVVNTILNVHWRILSVRTQDLIKNLQGRSVCLDIHAVTSEGEHVNIEVQRANQGATLKRARYHSSILDANTLLSGEEFDNLPENYVIFITERDVLGFGKPVYHIDRFIEEVGERFRDGAHIVYVNGEVQDETPLGRLMHDFVCTDADAMHYTVLAERVRYFKENKEGIMSMSSLIEELRAEVDEEKIQRAAEKRALKLVQQAAQQAAQKAARKAARKAAHDVAREIAAAFVELGQNSLESIAGAVRLPIAEVQEIARSAKSRRRTMPRRLAYGLARRCPKIRRDATA